MRVPHGGHAHFQNQVGILLVICRRKRPAFVAAILMPADAVNRIRFAVQQKSLLLRDRDRAQAKRLNHLVHHVISAMDANGDGVKIRIFPAVPPVRVGNVKNFR